MGMSAWPGVSVADLIDHLERNVVEAGGASNCALATDGDGTLWTGDVGEAFLEAVRHAGFVGEGAKSALQQELQLHDLPMVPSDSSERLVSILWDAYVAGTYPEARMCATTAWCTAGTSLVTLAEMATSMLVNDFKLRERLIGEAWELVAWGAQASLPVWLVSASPRVVVEAAAAIACQLMDLPPFRVIAMTPSTDGGVVGSGIVGEWPYGDGKARALSAALAPGNLVLVGAMGDNVFDLSMLRAASVAVAIRPKPALLTAATGFHRLLIATQRT